MIGGIVITRTGPTPLNLGGRDAKGRFLAGSPISRIQTASFFKIGSHWHREYLPEHFKNSARSRYPEAYKPRKGERGNEHPKGFKKSYTGRKLAKFGHTLPLVFTGETRRLAMIRDVRAKSTFAHVIMHGRKLNFKNRHSKINMREEATVINVAEEREIGEVFNQTFQRGIDVIRSRTDTKVV